MRNGIEHIGKYIAILYRANSMYFNKNFHAGNIGSGQYSFLLFLVDNEGVTQEEMSSRMFIDKGTTAKALKKLQKEGYIRKSIDENDKRAHRVYLTEDGRRITKDIMSVLDQWNNILTKDFTPEEKTIAMELLKRMLENKNKM